VARLDHTPRPVGNDVTGDHLTVTEPLAPPDVAVVAVRGEVDGPACPWLSDRLVAHVRSTHHLVIDLSDVSFLGAAGLTVLVVVREEALLERCRLCVVTRTRLVRLPLMITGLVDVFDVHGDLVSALVCRKLPAGPRPAGPRQPADPR
jgi:anti-sigma B factor antagonist